MNRRKILSLLLATSTLMVGLTGSTHIGIAEELSTPYGTVQKEEPSIDWLLEELNKAEEIPAVEVVNEISVNTTLSGADLEKSTFIEQIAPIVKEYSATHGTLPSVTIAQAILESNWGQSRRAKEENNILGVTARKGKQSKGGTTVEKRADGSSYVTKQAFAYYESINESIEDYSILISTASRYAGAVNNKNYKEVVTILKNGGYASDPNYVNLVCSIIKSNDLTRFDN